MMLISVIHITDTELNITLIFGNTFTRNAELTVAVVRMELRPAQQLQ